MKNWIKIAIPATTALGLFSGFFDDVKCKSVHPPKKSPHKAAAPRDQFRG